MIRTRFAPSPTGFMHVGNLRTALYAWLLARADGGKFILRIEDTDRSRYVDDAVEVIYATLARAGLSHDEGPDKDGGFGPYIQSERKAIYRDYAEKLVALGGAYYCFCEKQEDTDEGKTADYESGCPGHCCDLSPAEVEAKLAAGTPYVIRQKVLRTGTTTFTDAVYGEITIENKVLDDQILLKGDGMPTYNFANVIDDHLMQITHVVRGSEYLSSTPKYNMLYNSFGWDIPVYVHLPLIMGRDAEGNVSKLSKRHGSVSFENLVAEGYLPQAIVNYIALLGWSPKSDREIFSLAELAENFNTSGLNKSSAVFDYDKLRWMNSEYIKNMDPAEFAAAALPFSGVAGTALESKWQEIAAVLQPRTEVLADIPEKIGFLLALPDFGIELFDNKKSKCNAEIAKAILAEVIPQLQALDDFTAENINRIAVQYSEKHEVKLGQPMWAIRIAAAGQTVTPGGAGEIASILGKEETLCRLTQAFKRL